MSQPNDTATNTVLSSVESSEVVVEKQSLIQRRIVTPIKNHPKVATAIGAGLVLVGVAAYAGRATAPDSTLELTPSEQDDLEALVAEAEDTPVA